jgi:hypothetical protein
MGGSDENKTLWLLLDDSFGNAYYCPHCARELKWNSFSLTYECCYCLINYEKYLLMGKKLKHDDLQ